MYGGAGCAADREKSGRDTVPPDTCSSGARVWSNRNDARFPSESRQNGNSVRAQLLVFVLATSLLATSRLPASAQERCRLEVPAPVLSIPYATQASELMADPAASMWAKSATASMSKDCTWDVDYPDLKTEIRAFYTDTHVYFLFVNPYRTLNVFLPAQGEEDQDKLWDRDVVEMFLAGDRTNINRYREFEIAPTGDRVDLAIDYERKQYDQRLELGLADGRARR